MEDVSAAEERENDARLEARNAIPSYEPRDYLCLFPARKFFL